MRRFVAALVPFHRVILVTSSVLLGVVGSLVAENMVELSNWAFLVSAGVLLFLADYARQIEDRAVILADSAKVPVVAARRDVLTGSDRRTVVICFSGVLVITVLGLAVAFKLI